MGSNETMQEELEEERDENNNNYFGPSNEGSNLSSHNNTSKVPELKEMEIFIASSEFSDISAVKRDAEFEELKALADSDVKHQESLNGDEEMVDSCNKEEGSTDHAAVVHEKEIEPISGEFSDICINKEGSSCGDGSLFNNNNNAVVQEEEIEPFSGVYSDSDVTKVRELIESDPFIRQVVVSFLKYHDEMKSDEQNGDVSANGGSTLSDAEDTEMADQK